MKVQATRTWNFTVQRASQEVCDTLNKSYGTLEVLDEDGDRYSFATTKAAALMQINEFASSEDVYGGDTSVEEV